MIHQVVSAAGPYDAVTRQALAYREVFARWRRAGGVYAGVVEPGVRGVEPVARLQPARDDLVLFHYSAYAPKLERLLGLPQRKLLVYHNVTPARFLWPHHAHTAVLCELGRDHLPRWAQAVDVACAVSEFNAAELREAGAREVHVVPVLFEAPERAPRAAPPGSAPLVLTVGRIAPHKRHDLVVRAFALYQRTHSREARLALPGVPLTPGYRDWLAGLAARAGAERVEMPGAVSDAELASLYRAASVFVMLSEHEGFCVPLLEAFAHGIPVVARRAGAMPEVGGDAVLWVDDEDPAVIAELIHLAATDTDLRSELCRRGRARLDDFTPARTEEKLRAAILGSDPT